jgi:tetratricopeptide (TPR) repeat protein
MRRLTLIILAITISVFGISCANAKEKMSPKGRVNLRNANMYRQQLNLDKAKTFYEEVLKENPDNLESIKYMGEIYYKWGEEKVGQPIDTTKSEAAQKLQRIKYDNESVDSYISAYEQYQKYLDIMKTNSDSTKEEIEWRKDSAKKIKGCFARIFLTGQGYVSANDYSTALPIFEKLYQIEPQEPKTMKMMLKIYSEQQNAAQESEKASFNPKIEDLLNKLIALNPKDPETLSKLGAFYYTNKQIEKALPVFKQIEILKPKDVDNLFNLVGIYNDKKMMQEAYDADLKILAIEPNNVDAVDNARIFAVELKKTEEAKKHFQKLMELNKTADNMSQYCYFLSSNAMYVDLLPVAQEWFEMDSSSKIAAQFIVLAAGKLGKKEMVNYYNNILKKME